MGARSGVCRSCYSSPCVRHPRRDARGKSGRDGQPSIIVAVILVRRNKASAALRRCRRGQTPRFHRAVQSRNGGRGSDPVSVARQDETVDNAPHIKNRRREPMTNRREFLQTTAGALTGLVFVGCDLMAASPARAQARRREVVVNGKRVKTVDVHAHCAVPEALALMNLKLEGRALRPDLDMASQVAVRLQAMDEQGIDVEALSINPNWYKTDRDLAKQIIKIQNEKLAEACAANPERFVAYATVALQHPDLAAEQLEEAVKKYGLRGAAIGGNVAGEEISDPKFHPF